MLPCLQLCAWQAEALVVCSVHHFGAGRVAGCYSNGRGHTGSTPAAAHTAVAFLGWVVGTHIVSASHCIVLCPLLSLCLMVSVDCQLALYKGTLYAVAACNTTLIWADPATPEAEQGQQQQEEDVNTRGCGLGMLAATNCSRKTHASPNPKAHCYSQPPGFQPFVVRELSTLDRAVSAETL